MPSRRSHTKSHHGCAQCKTRRVKCDETLPECVRCVRRQMQCSFREQTRPSFILDGSKRSIASGREIPDPTKDLVVNAPTPVSLPDSTSTQLIASQPQPRSFGLLELELIHHYSTQTYFTLTSRLTSHIIWRDVMFREAKRCDFLLDALMATSALHKSTLLPDGSEGRAEYARRALGFQNSALSAYIPALSNPTQTNSIGLITISMLLPVWSFGSKRLPEGFANSGIGAAPALTNNDTHDATNSLSANDSLDFASIIALLQIIQGINQVLRETRTWVQVELKELLTTPTDDDLPPNQPDVTAAFDMLRDAIDGMYGEEAVESDMMRERHRIYLARLRSLRTVARARTILEWDLYIFSWPVTVEPLYIDLLKQHDPMSLVLFVHWAACFRSMDHLWWARDWSHRLVRDVSAYLDVSWMKYLEWPRRSLGLDYQLL